MAEVVALTFFVTLLPVLILIGVSYYRNRELYRLLYILAAYSYINTVAYTIDVFRLGEGGVLVLLAVSAVALIGLGWWLSNE
jgi:hypothetical protein